MACGDYVLFESKQIFVDSFNTLFCLQIRVKASEYIVTTLMHVVSTFCLKEIEYLVTFLMTLLCLLDDFIVSSFCLNTSEYLVSIQMTLMCLYFV